VNTSPAQLSTFRRPPHAWQCVFCSSVLLTLWANRSCCDKPTVGRNLELADPERTCALARLVTARCILRDENRQSHGKTETRLSRVGTTSSTQETSRGKRKRCRIHGLSKKFEHGRALAASRKLLAASFGCTPAGVQRTSLLWA
jgi:hypothetical protein